MKKRTPKKPGPSKPMDERARDLGVSICRWANGECLCQRKGYTKLCSAVEDLVDQAKRMVRPSR